MGKFDLNKPLERGSETVHPFEIHVHPDWKNFTESYDADIALITFEKPVAFQRSIFPVCLWGLSESPIQGTGTVVGWGRSEKGGIHENKPREATLTLKNNEECFLENHRNAIISSKRTFCAGNPEVERSVCSGDSGSGLFIEHENHFYLLGIVSSSLLRAGQCDVGNYAVYTSVLKFKGWIETIAMRTEVNLPKLQAAPNLPKHPVPTETSAQHHSKEIVCSLVNWSAYRPAGGAFTVDDVKPELCTTLVYHYAGFNADSNEIFSLDPWQDLEDNGGKNGYKKATALKDSHPHLRVLLAVGGWNEGSKKFSTLAASEESSKAFAKNAAKFVRKFNFDGLNFYWDHPVLRGGAPSDKQNFVQLLQRINDVFKAENLYLSATLRPAKYIAEQAYDIKNIAKHVDTIYLPVYDFKGSWDLEINFPAALRGDDEFNAQQSVKYFVEHGAPPEKLILGIPFFGRTFVTNAEGRIGDATIDDSGFQGPLLKLNGQLGYNEYCQMSKTINWTTNFDKKSAASICKFSLDGKNHVAVMETPRSVANKARFVVENRLGGIWAWSIDTDDFNGSCEADQSAFDDFPTKSKTSIQKRDFPLLRTAREAFDLLA